MRFGSLGPNQCSQEGLAALRDLALSGQGASMFFLESATRER
jgi:hypothetical protein